MIKKVSPASLLLLFSYVCIIGQEQRSPAAIAWYPQLMFIRGLRVDVDIHLGNSRSWLILSPHYYLANRHPGTSYENYDDYNSSNAYKKLEGYGAELHHRIYIINNLTPEGIYMSYGIQYGHFDLTYEDYCWGEIDYIGTTAITYGLFEHQTTIDKIGPNFIIGYQKQVLDRIFVDFFCGGGIRYSFISTSDLYTRNFDSDPFQFGYTGTVPLTGFRIGISL